MLKRNFLSIILLLTAINVSAQTYSGGTGTSSNPYLISSKTDMVALANAVNSGTNSYKGKFFRLTQNLTGANALTTSIGIDGISGSYAFEGVFDGNGFEVEMNKAQGGIFDFISYATIQSLGVKGTISTSSKKGQLYVGGICGYAANSKIAYCYNTASLSISDGENINVGGICGSAYNTTITDCFNYGILYGSSSINLLFGGICGAGGDILNCFNVGNISAVVGQYGDVAGVCGSSAESIKNCFSANTSIETNSYGSRIINTITTFNIHSNNYALSTMTINGSTNNSSNTVFNGINASLSNFKSQSWIQANLGWDFNTVWQMSSSNSVSQGFPVLRNETRNFKFSITATATNNGNISPNGNSLVGMGESKSYTITPNPGFQIYQVLINGTNNSQAVSSGSYTFIDVSRDHTIDVFFRPVLPPTFSGGSGTKESPYLISSKADMVALAGAVEGGTTYVGKYFCLTKNLTGSNAVSTSVGNYGEINSAFGGVFDGRGYEIELNNAQGGVFGYIFNTTIQNLGVIGNISASSKKDSNIGGICGYSVNSTIAYCYNAASVSISDSKNINFGGICGSTSNATITDCYNRGVFSFSSSSGSFGGICGYIYGNILNCYNVGNIFVDSQYYNFSGGICGRFLDNTSIKNSFSANAKIESTHLVGRIIGYFYGNIELSNNYALSNMNVNGSTVNSSDATSRDGAGVLLTNFKSQSWLQNNLGWDFNVVWKMSSSGSVNQGFPVFREIINPTYYTLSVISGSGGSITPSGSVLVEQGGNQIFTITPNIGYEINQVLVDGTNNTTAVSTGEYTFTNITANHTISVSFKQKQYTIIASAGIGGSISPSGNILVTHGGIQTFAFTPITGYLIDRVFIDGLADANAVASGQFTFENVTGNHSISVTFMPECLSDIVVQVWDDVLSVINNFGNNGGYTFVAYQWLKNGVEILGETNGYLYLTNDADKNISQYTCRLTTSNGKTLQSCPLQLTSRSAISAYPNPTEGIVIIESSTIEKGDRIDVYNATGVLVKQYSAKPNQTEIDLGNMPKGMYIIKVNGNQMKVILK